MFHKMTSSQIELIKWVGMFSMLLDHTAVLFCTDCVSIRAAGRIAFPIFGYVIIHNYIFYSKDKTKYMKRLLLLAILSEPFHYLLFQKYYAGVNVIFLYAMTLFTIFVFERSCDFFEKQKFIKANIFFYFTISIFVSFFIEYDIRGYLLLLSFYFLFKYRQKYMMLLSFFVLSTVDAPYPLYIVSSLAVFPLIYISSKIYTLTIPRSKSLFYWFYPVHMGVLLLFYIG